jgi:hypothetical protein
MSYRGLTRTGSGSADKANGLLNTAKSLLMYARNKRKRLHVILTVRMGDTL